MSSGEQQSDGEYRYAEPPEPEPEMSRLLDDVLNRTEQTSGEPADQSVLQLAAVLQKRGEDHVTREGLAELVTEVLRDYAHQAGLSEQTWKNLSLRVAGVLFEDPSARERLDRLWKQLTEVQL